MVRAQGGDPREITKRTWVVDGPGGRPRTLMSAEYKDPRGRLWQVMPEYVDTRTPDGYELVTTPLSDAREIVVLGPGESAEVEIACDFEPEKITIDPDAVVLMLDREQAIADL